jgi:hypothetical protein
MIKAKISPEEDVIDTGFLDLIGREFATHEKGLAEWLKNAVDANLTAGFRSGLEPVVLRFSDGRVSRITALECIDFVGMTQAEIEGGFKPWGRLSHGDERIGHYGGYGIGGKFYMRQMFRSSYVVTYRHGMVNIFGFDTNHAYGYAQGYRDRRMDPQEACRLAEIDEVVQTVGMVEPLRSGKRGFSVFRGIDPKGVGTPIDVEDLCERLRNHPQAQRPLRSCRVWVMHNGIVVTERVQPRVIPRRPGFQRPWVRRIPSSFPVPHGRQGKVLRLSNKPGTVGSLRLFVSREPLVQNGKMASVNRIDFVVQGGIAASYRIDEINAEAVHGNFIFGECRLVELEGFETRYTKKTRDKLVDTAETRSLLQWIGAQVGVFSNLIDKRCSEGQL